MLAPPTNDRYISSCCILIRIRIRALKFHGPGFCCNRFYAYTAFTFETGPEGPELEG
jgi:hypothetical protein